ncbi:MAG: RluA family pseudouridine synthase [Bacteroidota bacterium]
MKKLDILFEDDELIVINKAAPLLTIPDRFHDDKLNLYHLLKAKYGEIFIVHRLDKETSGVICFAKTAEAHKNLTLQFEHRQVQKIYHAIVAGRVETGGQIATPIAAHPHIAGKMTVHKKGKAALSLYEVLEQFKRYTLLAIDLKTGRTHQIRVHCASINHPLAIDTLYSKKEVFFVSEIKQKTYRKSKMETERPLMTRLTLHAFRLQLQHPTSNETLQFEAPYPKDFRAMLKQLQKWGK